MNKINFNIKIINFTDIKLKEIQYKKPHPFCRLYVFTFINQFSVD